MVFYKAVGTPLLKSVEDIAEAFKGYCVWVLEADEDDVWRQKAQITGRVIEGRMEMVVVSEDTPDIPKKR